MIRIDRTDLSFQLFDVLDAEKLQHHDRYADYDRTAIEGVLDTAEKIALEYFLPHAAKSDENEPVFVNGKVEIIEEVGEALNAYREAGFFGAGFDHEWGGAQMPELVRSAAGFMFSMANLGTAAYPLLTNGVSNLLAAFGSPDQKARFLRPLVEGRYFGTMCLSEPQAGSSLSDITTLAKPVRDGVYHITGSKMWISGGDQEISENIIHMVLARTPGAPAGVKGLSLFITPKYLVNDDGTLGKRNGVTLAGLNHKMGYRGATNTLLNFGEGDPCTGYLVGELNKGLSYMFQMMNEARIAVGLGAAAAGAAGYQASLSYARERPQGRLPDQKDPTLPQTPIINHADIRRLLLAQKTAAEGALALLLYAARLVDKIRCEPPEETARDQQLLDLLTPVAKSWPSEFCLEGNKHAIQILGGYGYTRDYPVERLYRDNRLNPIHEGAHGIHGLDLLGRKVVQHDGAAFKELMRRIRKDIRSAASIESLSTLAATLETHLCGVEETTRLLTERLKTDARLALANASIFLDMLGHVVIGWMWLRQATTASRLLESGQGAPEFLHGKIGACRYFFSHTLPHTSTQRTLLNEMDSTTLDMRPEWF